MYKNESTSGYYKEIPLSEILDVKTLEHTDLKKELTHMLEIKTQGSTYYIGKLCDYTARKRVFKSQSKNGLILHVEQSTFSKEMFSRKSSSVQTQLPWANQQHKKHMHNNKTRL